MRALAALCAAALSVPAAPAQTISGGVGVSGWGSETEMLTFAGTATASAAG